MGQNRPVLQEVGTGAQSKGHGGFRVRTDMGLVPSHDSCGLCLRVLHVEGELGTSCTSPSPFPQRSLG